MSNYKTGIDLSLSGSSGSDYYIEQLYYKREICDEQIIYIKQATNITAAHNARNVKSQGVVLTGDQADYGTIRYKVDQEGRSDNSVRYAFGSLPQLTGTLNFANMTYLNSSSVLGATGDNGGTRGNEDGTYWTKGLLDSVGDEWHTFLVYDDDSGWLTATEEYKASDGFYYLFVVNPKTPCISFAVTGSGKFYTTPAKKYWIPKIYDQTTYAEGTFTVTIKDINGNNVFYRINGGSFTDAGTSSVTLDQDDFSSGSNTLEYYYAGNAAYTKTRTVVKDPTHPGLSEVHGNLLWGTDAMWANIASRSSESVYTDVFARLEYDNAFHAQDDWGSSYANGYRKAPTKAFNNAFVAKLRGNDYSEYQRSGTGSTTPYAQFAKEMLIDSAMTIANVGWEMNWPGQAIPAKEIYYRGYYDVDQIYSMAFSYDILIDQYRSDQHSSGITPVEDYFVRDRMARFAHECLQYSAKDGATGGMWSSARQMGAIAVGMVMPTYDTPYYGTSGFDDTTTESYVDCPFPGQSLTWKTFLIGDRTSFALPGSPNMEYPGVSIADQGGIYTGVITSIGDWSEKSGYFEFNLMRHCYEITGNLLKLYYPSVFSSGQWQIMETCFTRAVAGTLNLGRKSMFLEMNYLWPSLATQNQIDWIDAASGNESRGQEMYWAKALGATFFDHDYPTNPPAVQVNTPTFSPAAGIYTSTQTVTISTTTQGATIRYRTDGVDPTSTTGTIGTSVEISVDTDLRAIAYNGTDEDSSVRQGNYYIQAAPNLEPPSISHDGIYMEQQTITITPDASAEHTYYTTDGSTPDTGDTEYVGTFVVSSDTVIKAYSVAAGYTSSIVSTATVNIGSISSVDNTFTAMTIPTQSDDFEITFDITTDAGSTHNLVFGLAFNFPAGFTFSNYPIVARALSQVWQGYNLSSYQALNVLAVSGSTLYHVSIQNDVSAKQYTMSITPDGGSEVLIASAYNYRNQGVADITQFVVWNQTGTPGGTFDNFSIGAPQPPQQVVRRVSFGGAILTVESQ